MKLQRRRPSRPSHRSENLNPPKLAAVTWRRYQLGVCQPPEVVGHLGPADLPTIPRQLLSELLRIGWLTVSLRKAIE